MAQKSFVASYVFRFNALKLYSIGIFNIFSELIRLSLARVIDCKVRDWSKTEADDPPATADLEADKLVVTVFLGEKVPSYFLSRIGELYFLCDDIGDF